MSIEAGCSAYQVWSPRGGLVPIVASIPHSGTLVPDHIANNFVPAHLAWLRNTDWHLPEVFSFLPELGITTIVAAHSRWVIDLNRDPVQIFGRFGTAAVAEYDAFGCPTHISRPSAEDLCARVEDYHEPYHRKLDAMLDGVVDQFGSAILLDLHAFMAPSDNDICLGNLKGRSSKAVTLDALYRLCIGEGFTTALNEPFAGAYILRRHHRASVDAIQIELRYSNYMDCANIDVPGRPELDEAMLKTLRPRLRNVVESFCAQRIM